MTNLFTENITRTKLPVKLLEQTRTNYQTNKRQVALIEGQAGIGKTFILGKTKDLLKNNGCLCLAGRAVKTLFKTPNQLPHAIIDAMNSVSRVLISTEINKQLIKIAPSWSNCLYQEPRTSSIHTAAHKSKSDSFDTQELIFLLEFIARTYAGPVVLCIDDLHYADEVTLNILVLLIQRQVSTPLFFIFSFDPGKARNNPEFIQFQQQIDKELKNCTYRLKPLTGLEQEALVINQFQKLKNLDQLSEPLNRLSGGNPRLILQLIRHWVAEKEIINDGDVWYFQGKVDKQFLPNPIISNLEQQIHLLSLLEIDCLIALQQLSRTKPKIYIEDIAEQLGLEIQLTRYILNEMMSITSMIHCPTNLASTTDKTTYEIRPELMAALSFINSSVRKQAINNPLIYETKEMRGDMLIA